MKNFYYELLTGTLNLEFDPDDYLEHEDAIDELVNNLNITIEETQELISKIEKVEKFQTDKIAEIEAYTKVDYVRFIICAVTVASVTFILFLQLGVLATYSFIFAMVIMSLALIANMIAIKVMSRNSTQKSLIRGAFAEHALNTLYTKKRQQAEVFMRSNRVYSRADFDKLLEETKQLIVARNVL